MMQFEPISSKRSCEDVHKEDMTPADFGIVESEQQKAIYFAEYMLHRGVVNMQEEIERLKEDLRFVERWAVHHGTKPHMTAQEALSFIQHYPPIKEITKSYVDGVIPNTYDPFAEIDELRAKLKALEEQKPVAMVSYYSNRSFSGGYRHEFYSPTPIDLGSRLYLAAGAKHD